MKKQILAFLIFISVLGYSQVKVNPNVGLTFSKLTNGASTKIRTSYVAGFDLRFGDVINFIPGLYFGNVGTDVDYTENSVVYQYNNSINTLQLRTLVGLNIPNLKVLRIRAVAGPTLHLTVQSSDLEKENFKTAIAFLNAGVGLDLGILTIDLRYEYGLTNVFGKYGPENIRIETNNNIVILSVGLVF